MNKLSIDIRHLVLLLLNIMPELGIILSSYYNRLYLWIFRVKVVNNHPLKGKIYLSYERPQDGYR